MHQQDYERGCKVAQEIVDNLQFELPEWDVSFYGDSEHQSVTFSAEVYVKKRDLFRCEQVLRLIDLVNMRATSIVQTADDIACEFRDKLRKNRQPKPRK